MKLWLLQRISGLPRNIDPWYPWYDKTFGLVIRAETEKEAREIATKNTQYEYSRGSRSKEPWLDPELSTCEALTNEGEVGVILEDFHAA